MVNTDGEELKLTELDGALIAKNILFMKIFQLPRSRWSAVKDKIVNVPIEDTSILQTVNSFPRLPSDAGILPVKLKRKVSYKAHHLKQYIRPNIVLKSLEVLKDMGNPHYQFVASTEHYEEKFCEEDPEGILYMPSDHDDVHQQAFTEETADDNNDNDHHNNDSGTMVVHHTPEYYDAPQSVKDANEPDGSSKSDDDAVAAAAAEWDAEEKYCIKHDPVRKWQYTQDEMIFMTNMYPETQVNVHNDDTVSDQDFENQGISVAPGEGQTPSNILKEHDWDVKTFPQLFPDGKFGLHYERQQKLTPLQYFNQRLLNMDICFSSTPGFVYAALSYLEKQQLNRNISMSYSRGTSRTSGDGTKILTLEDGFAVLDNISNTPRYWQQAKNELIAKLENLGPFQLFFTLSCAERRWMENLHAVLKDRLGDVPVAYVYKPEESLDSGPETTLLLDGQPWEDYLQQNGVEFNVHEEMRKNVLTLTRNFNQRVKMFVKNIVKGDNNPMNVKYYNYRVEFQSRGAGHVHGVLWLDLDAVERGQDGNKIQEMKDGQMSDKLSFPGVKPAMQKIKNDHALDDHDIQCLTSFIDAFVTVDLTDPEVQSIVREVNIHHHTKTCRKKGTTCRFQYPKFPSTKTIISKPYMHMDVPDKRGQQVSDDKKRKLYQKLHAKLDQVQNILEDEDVMKKIEAMPSEQQIPSLCKEAGVSLTDYEAALEYSSGKYGVVLKRSVGERFVNSYNQEWIKAWDGNMDMQVCLDYFAVITYITDYVSKDSSELMHVLLQVAKQCQSDPIKEKMKTVKNTFLTHRQMGEAEVYFRLFPELHLKESNIKAVFLPTGFPEHRSSFLKKVNSEERHQYSKDSLVTISGKDGEYVEKPSMISKYSRRPPKLEGMCLMEFAKVYDAVSRRTSSGKMVLHFLTTMHTLTTTWLGIQGNTVTSKRSSFFPVTTLVCQKHSTMPYFCLDT